MIENLGAIDIGLTPDEMRQLEVASAKIEIAGERYPGFHQQFVGR